MLLYNFEKKAAKNIFYQQSHFSQMFMKIEFIAKSGNMQKFRFTLPKHH